MGNTQINSNDIQLLEEDIFIGSDNYEAFEELSHFSPINLEEDDWMVEHTHELHPTLNSNHIIRSGSNTFQLSAGSVLQSIYRNVIEQFGSSWSSNQSPASNMPMLFLSSDRTMRDFLGIFGSVPHSHRKRPRMVFSNHERPKFIGICDRKKIRNPLKSKIGSLAADNINVFTKELSSSSFDELKCPICLDIFDQPVLTPCLHIFCTECIIASMIQQSSCPLCRSISYSHSLMPLNAPHQNKKIQAIYSKYRRLVVQCCRCQWIGSLTSWEKHRDSPDCEIRQRNGVNLETNIKQLSISTHRSTKNASKSQQHEKMARFFRSESKLSPCPIASSTSEQNTLPRSPSISSSSSSSAAATQDQFDSLADTGTIFSTDKLIAWLSDHSYNRMNKLYIIHHYMENLLGALAGEISKSAHHEQAVIEIINSENDNYPHNGSQIFLSIELFGSPLVGLDWQIYQSFPPMRSTAHQINSYMISTEQCSVQFLIHYLTDCREKKYELLRWNCQTFISELKKVLETAQVPETSYSIPRPESFSENLMDLLHYVLHNGSLPVLECSSDNAQPRQVSNKFVGFCKRLISRKKRPINCENSNVSENSQGVLRIRDVFLCLFPPEDLHRASFWPAVTISHLWNQVLPLKRPQDNSRQMLPLASNIKASYGRSNINPTKKNINSIKLRHQSLPVLILHIQTQDYSKSNFNESWSTICYLSLELRSDHGLWWHVYRELPPGLFASPRQGGTNFVVSGETSFSLDSLIDALESLRNKRYHSTTWSGWEFSEFLLKKCCPAVADDLLQFQSNQNITLSDFVTMTSPANNFSN